MLVRCNLCRGTKQSMGLGSILGKCNACDGSGMVILAEIMKPVTLMPIDDPSNLDLIHGVAATQEHKVELIEPLSHAPKVKAPNVARKVFKRVKS